MKCHLVFRSLLVSMLLLASVSAGATAIDTATGPADARFTAANDQGQYRYLIEFAEPGLLRRQAGRAPGQRFDINAPGMREAQRQLQVRQAAHRQAMERAVGRTLEITHYYLVSHSGVALWLNANEAETIARMEGVVSVERERVYELDTYRGPEFIGADTIWDGSAVPGGSGLLGEDLAIAVLDTGVDPSHPSFANVAACGHDQGGNPDKLISFLDCATTDIDGLCNGPGAVDTNGHGSHTAGTAGGNVVDGAAVPPPSPPPPFTELSGVAPCAYLRTYKVCPNNCPGAQIQAGMDSVLLQQSEGPIPIVSMNFSISGGLSPWNDNDRKKLDLVDAGIFVAASAGNTSDTIPDPVGNVGHRGPWVMSVANISHDVISANPLSLDGGPTDEGAVQGTGPGLVTDYTGQLRWAGDAAPGNETGCAAFPAGAFTGEAALIIRGDCNFSVKVDNAVAAGANFVVVFNQLGGPPIVMGGLEGTTVSSVMVSNSVGLDLVAALGGGTAELTVLAAVAAFQDPDFGDVLSGGSLIGPTPAPLQHLQKPDIAAPGTSILAAVPGGYAFISGTSMSSPHVAGAATLMRQAQPDWTVTEIKSALQMTAFGEGKKADGDTPWDADDVGHGRTDLSKAALAGVVMDETTANFLAADPNGGTVDVRDLNLAGVRNVDCTPDCTWTRTVRNTLSDPSSWTVSTSAVGFDIVVSPTTFNFTGDTSETEELTITATPIGNQTGAVAFGEVILTEDGSLSPEQHITVAIMGGDPGAPEIDVDPASLSATVPEGDSDIQTLTVANIGNGDLDWNIVQGGGDSWSDDFDSYANGSDMHGQGGWKGWDNDPTFGALVTDAQANSAPHSVEIVGDSDLVRDTFTGITSGQWTLTAWQFIPAGFSGQTFFILLNTYADGGPNNWSTQVNFDDSTGLVTNDGVSGGTASMVTDQWVEIRVEIDFDANTQDFFYDGSLLYSGTWTEENTGGGTTNFGAIDLFANGATAVYYDDISLVPDLPVGCDALTDIPWLDAAPTSGTTLPAGETDVDVTFDASGLTSGDVETATLCVTSNDPANSVVQVPVELTVVDGAAPVADITPADFSFTLPLDSTDSDVLDIGNTGDADLTWTIETALVPDGTGGGIAYEYGVVHFTGVIQSQPASGRSHRAGEAGDMIRVFDGGIVPEPQGGPITDDFDEGFEDITLLPGAGWAMINNSTSPGTIPDWTQGGTSFDAHAGPLDSYIGSSFQAVAGAGDLSHWLITPEMVLQNGTELRFWTRTTEQFQDFNDRLEVRLSTAGSSTDVGTTPDSVGDFDELTLTINPNLEPNVYPEEWTEFIVTVEGLGAATSGRFAFRHWVPNSGPNGSDGDFIGIDTFSITQPQGGCSAPDGVPWLSADPISGTTPPTGSEPVDVTVDSTGLTPGDHEALLCITTNDPDAPLVEVPVSLTVLDQDPPVLAVDPAALDFGEVAIGATEMMSFDVSNEAAAGAADLALTAITPAGDTEFAITGGDCDPGVTVLPPGDSCTVEVSFTPGAVGVFAGDVTVEGSGQTETVTLAGMGVEQDPAELDVSPLELDLGNVLVDSTGVAGVTVSNVAAEGAADLVFTEIEVISGDPAFSIGGTDCGATLAPQASCTVEVHFAPTEAGPETGFLRINAEDNEAVNVSLSGNGVEPEPVIFEDRFEEKP